MRCYIQVSAYPAGWLLSNILTIIVYHRAPFVKAFPSG